MNFNVEEIPSYRIAYIRRLGAYGVGNVQVMENLKAWAKAKNLFGKPSVILAIPHDNPQIAKEENCRYDACITIPDSYNMADEENVSEGKVSGGKYAVFQVEHTGDALQKAWMQIFSELQSKNIFLDENRPIFERYQFKMANNHFCEICVPILQ